MQCVNFLQQQLRSIPAELRQVLAIVVGILLSIGFVGSSTQFSSEHVEQTPITETRPATTSVPTAEPSNSPVPSEPSTEPAQTTKKTPAPTEEPTPLPAIDQRDSVVAAGLEQRGEVIGTSGKPAVALRFDHHLGAFDTKVLPLLEKYRLPWGQMMNGGIIEEEGMTFDDLAGAAHTTGGEVWNHGWSHASIFTEEEATREITQGLTDLREGLPSLWIDGWAQPGQADYMGLEPIPSGPDHYYGTYPGRLIINQHAFVRGYYPDTYHQLEGSNLIGQGHVTIDRQVDGKIQQYVRRAISGGTGVTLMLHPNYLDRPGFLTTAELDQALGYIAKLRDEDQIEVLSTTGILMAEDDLPEDHGNLLNGGGPGVLAGEWESGVPDALNHLGVPHEAEVWVSGTGTATLQVEVNSGSYPVASTHTIELTDEPKRMSVVVTPPMDTTSVSVSLTGDGAHQGISYQPL